MFKALLGLTIGAALVVVFLVMPLKADPLKPGAEAPVIEVVDQDGKPFSLAETYRKGMTLVYFYPKADTPGCTKQACNIRDKWEELQKAGIQVVGVSIDKPADQQAFQEKHKLPFPLIADAEGRLVKAFGVTTIRIGYSRRESFLVKDGRIIWHNPDVKPDTHVEEVLAAAKSAG